jgi:hypothetical protein
MHIDITQEACYSPRDFIYRSIASDLSRDNAVGISRPV